MERGKFYQIKKYKLIFGSKDEKGLNPDYILVYIRFYSDVDEESYNENVEEDYNYIIIHNYSL